MTLGRRLMLRFYASETRKHQHYARPRHVSFDEQNPTLATLAVEGFGRLGVEGSAFIDLLAASVLGGGGVGVDGEEGGGEGTPSANRLSDHTGHHFTEGVEFQAPAQGSPGGKKEPRG